MNVSHLAKVIYFNTIIEPESSSTTLQRLVHIISSEVRLSNGRTTPDCQASPLIAVCSNGVISLFRLGIRLLLVAVYPLRIVWSIIHALLSPTTIVFQIALDSVLFTPFSIIRMVAVALYPVYVFCAVACIFGAMVGIFGHYTSNTILSILKRSEYFTRPPIPPHVAPPASPQVTLRKRRRRAVRSQ
ncbi:hypothetical protein JVT61DRAFT_4791 [Boletus reticuloceps]|uniref:Uncharacterized protein n=1 Tax=Boletus reticuloceps TaxID=495285 RepID=A0A8I2YMZ9_9AGAM|nr:hypothetical protein JVT61DRAFT_4791 [Boletus reticuloceps]